MKILAIDSSGQVAGCCLMDENKVICEIILDDKLTHSQTLMPMVDELFKRTNLNIKDIDYIAVANGPGSFTGLRIGVATAIGLARGSGAELIGVSTLEVLAYNICGNSYICPIMDARRNQVYGALYKFEGNKLIEHIYPVAIGLDELLNSLSIYDDVTMIGDGVNVNKDILKNYTNINIAPIHLRKQRPSSLAVAAYNKIKNNAIDNGIDINYLRKSQAERERDAKNKRSE